MSSGGLSSPQSSNEDDDTLWTSNSHDVVSMPPRGRRAVPATNVSSTTSSKSTPSSPLAKRNNRNFSKTGSPQRYAPKRNARSQSPVLPSANDILNSNRKDGLKVIKPNSPVRGRSKSTVQLPSENQLLLDPVHHRNNTSSAAASSTRPQKGSGHQHKRSFGARFFSKLKDSSNTSEYHDLDHERSNIKDALDTANDTVMKQKHTISELNGELNELRVRYYNHEQFRSTVKKNVIIFHGLLICTNVIKRYYKYRMLRCFMRWIMSTWSNRIFDHNNQLILLRKKEHEKHGIVLRELLYQIQGIMKQQANVRKTNDPDSAKFSRREDSKIKSLHLSIQRMQQEILSLEFQNCQLKGRIDILSGSTKLKKSVKKHNSIKSTHYYDSSPSKRTQPKVNSPPPPSTTTTTVSAAATPITVVVPQMLKTKVSSSPIVDEDRKSDSSSSISSRKSPILIATSANSGNAATSANSATTSLFYKGRIARWQASTTNSIPKEVPFLSKGAVNLHQKLQQQGRQPISVFSASILHRKEQERKRIKLQRKRYNQQQKEMAEINNIQKRKFYGHLTMQKYKKQLYKLYQKHCDIVGPPVWNMSESAWVQFCRHCGIISGYLPQRDIVHMYRKATGSKGVDRCTFDHFLVFLIECAMIYFTNQQSSSDDAGVNFLGNFLYDKIQKRGGSGIIFPKILEFMQMLNQKEKNNIQTKRIDTKLFSKENQSPGTRLSINRQRQRVATKDPSYESLTMDKDDQSSDKNNLKELISIVLKSNINCQLQQFLNDGQPMLYTNFYQLVLVTLNEIDDTNAFQERSNEVRELMLECDPLGEGWIFPSIVNEYIRDVDTAFHINSSTNNSEKKGVMNGGDEKRNGKQQLQLPEHDFEW